jgi:hypothetical protein
MRLTSLPRIAFRILLAIFCANFATMLAMNVFKLAAGLQLWIYIVFFALFWWAAFLVCPKTSRLAELLPQREATWLVCGVLVMGLLYASVRFQYPLEPVMHRLALGIEDDGSHTQELNSLINSQQYPAQSSFTLSDYFSMYYAAWMLLAALYRALPFAFVTFKTVLFLGNAIYAILFPLALTHIVSESARSKQQVYWAIYLGGFWCGLDWLWMLAHPLVPNAFWLKHLGLYLDFAGYSQSTVITNHHLSSGIAMMLCAYIWHRYRGKGCVLFVSLLLCYAFYSSVFVFLGSFPFIAYLWLRSLRNRTADALAVCGLSSALIFPLLWLFLRKPGATTFEFPEPHPRVILLPRILGGLHLHYGFWSGFLLFMVVISLQFAYFTYVLIYKRRTLSRNEAILGGLAVAYIVSTYFVGFSHANNYCMRGVVVPAFVLSWIASSRMPVTVSRALAVLLVIAALPTFTWIANPILRGIKDTLHPHTFLQGTSEIVALNMDRSKRQVDYAKLADILSQKDYSRYSVEKMPTQPIEPLEVMDIELESFGPCGIWAWEKNPQIPAEPCPSK